jgi:hypothetical protein
VKSRKFRCSARRLVVFVRPKGADEKMRQIAALADW